MALVLDLDPAMLRKRVDDELLADNRPGRAQRFGMGSGGVAAMLSNHIGGFETIAADVEIETRHTALTRMAPKLSMNSRRH
jgi:hypothetical protein